MKSSIRRIAIAGCAMAMLLTVAQGGSASALSVIPKLRAAPTAATPPKFKTVGARVVGPDGRDFIMRGVNKAGFEYSAYGYDNDLSNYQKIKGWGANTIRLPIAQNFGMKGMCTYDKNYMGRIDRAANFAKQIHMLMVIDNHFQTKGQTCGAGGWSTNQKMPDLQSLNFVKQLGTRYKNNPYVAIDLHNEPHDISWDIWRNGGLVDGYRAIGMQQMLDGLRSTGFKGIAVVTGNHWGDTLIDVANNPLRNDGNVVYSGHTYPYWCGPHVVLKEEPYMCQGKQRPPFFESNFQPLIGKRPVIIGEFGTQRNIDGENRQVIQWAEDHKIGWLAWQWAAGKSDNYALLQEDGVTPTVQGKPVQDFLLKSQGWAKPNNGK